MTETSPTASPIAAAALAALEARRAEEAALAAQIRDTLVGIARDAIATRLTPLDASTLEVAHVDTDAWVAVLTDGTIHLAGTDDGDVFLVECVDDAWTRVAGPLSSLAHLGEVLA